MAYTKLQLIRKMIADPHKTAVDKQVGDASTKIFQLSHKPIKTSSYTVSVDAVQKTETTDYVIDKEKGLLTFVNAPASDKNVDVKYDYSVFSDEEITEFLTIEGNDENKVIVRLIKILLADSARRFDYESGQTKMTPSQVFDHLKQLLQQYQGSVGSTSSQPVVINRSNPYYPEDETIETDLSRSDD